MRSNESPKYSKSFIALAAAALMASTFYASVLEAEESTLSIRELLKKDFGVAVNIAGGAGHRNDPIVIRDTNPASAALTQMAVLKGLGRGEASCGGPYLRTSPKRIRQWFSRLKSRRNM